MLYLSLASCFAIAQWLMITPGMDDVSGYDRHQRVGPWCWTQQGHNTRRGVKHCLLYMPWNHCRHEHISHASQGCMSLTMTEQETVRINCWDVQHDVKRNTAAKTIAANRLKEWNRCIQGGTGLEVDGFKAKIKIV